VSVDSDQGAPTRRRGETGDEWAYRGQTEEAERADQRLLDGLAQRTSVRFEIQQAHYANALRQSTTYFYYSLGVGVAGFALLLAGVGLAFADLVQVGTVAALGGLLADAAAAMVFSQANRAKADAQTNLSSIAHAAEKDENSLMAYIYASRIEDCSMRDATNAALARMMAGSTDSIAVLPTDTPTGGVDRAPQRDEPPRASA
jgi:hypothetical protein